MIASDRTHLLLAVVAALFCAACTASGLREQPAPQPAAPGLPSIAPPAQSVRAVLDAPPAQQLDGSTFQGGSWNRMHIEGSSGEFSPGVPGSNMSHLAWGTYVFTSLPVGLLPSLTLSWSDPAPQSVYIGLSDWDAGTWKWFSHPAAELLVLPDLAPYIRPSDGVMAVVVCCDVPAQLQRISLGEPVPPSAVLVADPPFGPAPLLTTLDASGSELHGAVVTNYQWDFDNDGTIDRSTMTAVTSFSFDSAGTHEVRVRLLCEGGIFADTTAEVFVGGYFRLWGSGNWEPDRFEHLEVAPDGSLVVAGVYDFPYSTLTARFDPHGELLWAHTSRPEVISGGWAPGPLAVAPDGSIYRGASYSYFDSATQSLDARLLLLKFNLDGTFEWARAWTTGGNENTAVIALCTGPDGTVYMAAQHPTSSGGEPLPPAAVIAVNPDGTQKWRRLWGSANGSNAYLQDIDLCEGGDLSVLGYTIHEGKAGPLVLRIASQGGLKWQRVLKSQDPYLLGSAYSQAAGPGGGCFAAYEGATQYLCRVSAAGELEWNIALTGDNYELIDLDSSPQYGEPWILLGIPGTSQQPLAAHLLRLSADGVPMQRANCRGPALCSLDFSASGNLYISGNQEVVRQRGWQWAEGEAEDYAATLVDPAGSFSNVSGSLPLEAAVDVETQTIYFNENMENDSYQGVLMRFEP